MLFALVALAAIGVGFFEYSSNMSFKAKLSTLVATTQAELASLRTKAVTGVTLVEADFAKAEAAAKAIFAKL